MKWLIDAHAHLEDDSFDEDRDELMARLPEEGVLAVINPGCDFETSKKAIDLANTYENLFACVGTHPHEARFYDEALEKQYREWAKLERVVAIGEIGLDYHYDFSPRDKQRNVFEKQLQMAKDLNLPVVIHTREAKEDTYAILKNFGPSINALMHSFGESVEEAKKYIDFGYSLSLGGMITFKNAVNPPELAKWVPLDRILTETDAPYLAPVPKRGRRNNPAYLQHTIMKMAELKEMSADELAKITVENAVRFYGIEEEISKLR